MGFAERHYLIDNGDGRLLNFRQVGTYPDHRPLVPFSGDTFMPEGLPSFRLKFELDANGNPVKAVGL